MGAADVAVGGSDAEVWLDVPQLLQKRFRYADATEYKVDFNMSSKAHGRMLP